MKIFLDTANVEEIQHIMRWGVVDGVTTNQKIFAFEKGCSFEQRIHEICKMVYPLPVSVESNGASLGTLLNDARTFAKISPNIVVKIPMLANGEGLEAASTLSREGIKTNMTVMMTTNQVLLAAKANATYASIFFNRIRDAGEDPVSVIHEATKIIGMNGFKTQVIVGSIRDPGDVSQAAAAGAHIVTIPYKILLKMPFHAKTEETIKEFDRCWKEFLSNGMTRQS